MKKQELMKRYKDLMEAGKEIYFIMLYIHMPTGEQETIINPNVEAKIAYIDKTYNEDLVHSGCPDIYIVEAILSTADEEMDFGSALTEVKEGAKIARAGWNGKGMWVRMIERGEPSPCDNGMENLPYLEMKTADNKLVPWLASQSDVLAEDWVVVEPAPDADEAEESD